MEKLKALWQDIADSLWLLPTVMTLGAGALAVLLIRYNDEILGDTDAREIWWLFGGSAEGAKSVLESISGSIITVTGVVFSVTIIALQLASSQFTPRVLRQFMADRANQLVLGVFIGTFTFTLLVQRTVRSGEVGDEFIPAIAVTTAVLLALTSIGFLIFYIDHAARSVQAAVIIDSAAAETLTAVRRIFPDRVEAADDSARSDEAETAVPDEAPHPVYTLQSGYVQAVDRRKLREIALQSKLLIRLDIEIGEYLLPGHRIMSVWPATAARPHHADDLRAALVLGMERTPHQDVKHGIIELMDIAVKAMSPSINDPTTAVNSVQRISEILLELAWRERGDDVTTDDHGRPLVILRRPRLADTVDLAFNQIRHYAAENPTVAIALLETLGELAALSPGAARSAFLDQLREVGRSAHLAIRHDGDLARVERAAAAALARSSSPPPRVRPNVGERPV
jgi:uncharacterized membrane protein